MKRHEAENPSGGFVCLSGGNITGILKVDELFDIMIR